MQEGNENLPVEFDGSISSDDTILTSGEELKNKWKALAKNNEVKVPEKLDGVIISDDTALTVGVSEEVDKSYKNRLIAEKRFKSAVTSAPATDEQRAAVILMEGLFVSLATAIYDNVLEENQQRDSLRALEEAQMRANRGVFRTNLED